MCTCEVHDFDLAAREQQAADESSAPPAAAAAAATVESLEELASKDVDLSKDDAVGDPVEVPIGLSGSSDPAAEEVAVALPERMRAWTLIVASMKTCLRRASSDWQADADGVIRPWLDETPSSDCLLYTSPSPRDRG